MGRTGEEEYKSQYLNYEVWNLTVAMLGCMLAINSQAQVMFTAWATQVHKLVDQFDQFCSRWCVNSGGDQSTHWCMRIFFPMGNMDLKICTGLNPANTD